MKIRLDTNDTVLNGSFRITPETRILPEPAPPTSPADFGVRRVGNPGPVPKPADIDKQCEGYDEAHKRGYLTAAEVAALKAQVKRLSGSTGAHTGAAGVTTMFDTVKWKSPDGGTIEEISGLTQDDVDDLERAYSAGAIKKHQFEDIRAANKDKPKGTRTGMVSIDRALRASADISLRTRMGEDFNKAAADLWNKRA
jgi:hypothetical protein